MGWFSKPEVLSPEEAEKRKHQRECPHIHWEILGTDELRPCPTVTCLDCGGKEWLHNALSRLQLRVTQLERQELQIADPFDTPLSDRLRGKI